MIRIRNKGDWSITYKQLRRLQNNNYRDILESYGQKGVAALASATPKETGKTANSWRYEIELNSNRSIIHYVNDNINEGVNIALILQYGHGTGTGSYVAGRDYINPAIQPIFDTMADNVWKEVTRR